MDIDDAEAELQLRLDRYPADRYPVQHATARFHLGVARAGAGRLDEADRDLEVACRLFPPDQLPVEHAKAANARGAVQRLLGRLDDAVHSFVTAAGVFEGAGLPLEEGAARFNLGLVERQLGGDGTEAFERARTLLDPTRVPAQAAAAARELGAGLLTAGRPSEAIACLQDAVAMSERAGDGAGVGGAANVLGLAHLAAGDAAAAVAALEQAVAAHPRRVRPDGYAMAKANLALAEEARGRPDRARLAALHAAGTPDAAPSVQSQAAAVLQRVGHRPGAVVAVLEEEPGERWPALVRDELQRWVDADDTTRVAEATAWVQGQLAHRAPHELAECLLAILVELPPQTMDVVARAVVAALTGFDQRSRDQFTGQCSRAMARFPLPQLMRLKEHLDAVSAEAGLSASW